MSQNVQSTERPERSRNAKAQARHRAKRKAYIEQLEQTVTKLQTAMGVTPDQVAALPPPLAKIRELEQENARLAKENEDLRRLLAESGIPITSLASSNNVGYAPSPTSFNPPARMQLNRSLTGGSPVNGAPAAFHDARNLTDSYGIKRRKMSPGDLDSNFPSENTDLNTLRAPPPPLTIPHHSSSTNHYPSSHPSSHLSSPHPTSAHGQPSHHPFPSLGPPPFQMPNTPSASSATSSPPFSPAQMQTPSGSVSQSPVSQLSSLSRPGTSSSVSSMHPYNHGYVKVEEDNYHASHHNSSHHHPSSHSNTPSSSAYSLPPFDTMEPSLSGSGHSWQGSSAYSTSERIGPGGLGRSGNFLDWRHVTEVRDAAILA